MPSKKTTVTRGSASQKQRAYIESLAQSSSPPKVRKPKKSDKSASFELPEVTKTTPPVVTATKQAKSSNLSKAKSSNSSDLSNNNSTGNENASVTMESNLTTGADPRLDKQLDYILEEFLLAKEGGHKSRQMFQAEDIYQFMNFVDYTVEDLEVLRMKSHNSTKDFNKQKVTQIYNVIRYYNFL